MTKGNITMTTTASTAKTVAISLPADLADAVAKMAERDGKTLDDFVIQCPA